jgi:NAD(P)-dependent dehydrogenase (short-subunit alcohol dehydrogenase family)
LDPRNLLDWTLELTVIGSFGRPGLVLRRRLFGWDLPAQNSMAGRTVLVTGPTSGLGRAATETIAALGARVVLVGRSPERLAAFRDSLIREHGEDRFPLVLADMGSMKSVKAAASRVLATEPRLDVLIDNAGAMFPERTIGPDGIEATLATLVVGPFALEAALLPLMARTPGSRIVSVTSGGMYTQPVRLDDLQNEREPWSGPRAYARAKRIQVALVREWDRRLVAAGIDVTVNAMHPGWADTPGLAEALPGFYRRMRPLLRTPAEGADTIVWLATHPAASGAVPETDGANSPSAFRADSRADGGKLYLDRRERPFDRVPATRLTAADRRQLWNAVLELSGSPDPVQG